MTHHPDPVKEVPIPNPTWIELVSAWTPEERAVILAAYRLSAAADLTDERFGQALLDLDAALAALDRNDVHGIITKAAGS